MNLGYLLIKFGDQVTALTQAVQAHDTDPEWATRLWYCAKDVQRTAKWIARLSKRCPTLDADCVDLD